MNPAWRRLSTLVFLSIVTVAALLLLASPAFAGEGPYTISSPGGGACSSIGAWDAGTSTCTLNRSWVATTNGIIVGSSGITIDGAGQTITGNGQNDSGVILSAVNNVTVRNLHTSGFNSAFLLTNTSAGNHIFANNIQFAFEGVTIGGSSGNSIGDNIIAQNTIGVGITSSSAANTIFGNTLSINGTAIYISSSSSSNGVTRNTIVGGLVPSNTGIYITSANSNTIWENDFYLLATYAYVGSGTTNNSFYNAMSSSGNYWDNYSTPAQGCANSVFNLQCDAAHTVTTGFSDNYPYIIQDAWSRLDWTWYDNKNAQNWVLMGNTTAASGNAWYKLSIGNVNRALGPLPVAPGQTDYAIFEGLLGGPVVGANIGGDPSHTIASQRSLWPRAGGSSLEEVPAAKGKDLYWKYVWPYYDDTNGFADWILIENPNDFDMKYQIWFGNTQMYPGAQTLPAHGSVTPEFTGQKGGPVIVECDDPSDSGANCMASQRVLSNGGNAFNEMPGRSWWGNTVPDYIWTWYDSVNSVSDQIAIGNVQSPDMYYKIYLGTNPTPVKTGGPIGGYSTQFVTLPNTMGGPLRVKTFADPNGLTQMFSVASQRIVWGPSFEEVPGAGASSLPTNYNWTWYDEGSPGAQNWVLVSNPGTSPIQYTLKINGTIPAGYGSRILQPGQSETPDFPHVIAGPVEVTSTGPMLASQRVLWNGYFNEVLGTTLP